MADGFIVRKGGVTGTAAPSINFVSKTFDSITFTITNNDVLTADIFWEIGDSTPDANTFSLAGGATSSNQVASGLDEEETYTIFAFANAEGKAGSQTTSQVRTTPEEPLVYTAATGGTTLEYDSGGKRFKSHTFTSDGNFVVSTVGDNIDDRNKVDYLIIAGGGSGGMAGGGAGGFLTTVTPVPSNQSPNAKKIVTATTFQIVIGAGGANAAVSLDVQNDGNNSTALGETATGGGAGAGNESALRSGENGGSGGGEAFNGGNIGTGILGQGRNGGKGTNINATTFDSGGGGGAGAVGQNAQGSGIGGAGGDGLANLLRTGSNENRAGGGGGGARNTGGLGGLGGGGNAENQANSFVGTAGTVNTGSGAGSKSAGGSGIVVIRYEIAPSV